MLQVEEWAGIPRPFHATHDEGKDGDSIAKEDGLGESGRSFPVTSIAGKQGARLSESDQVDKRDKDEAVMSKSEISIKQRLLSMAIRIGIIAVEVFLGMLIPFFSTLLGLAGSLSILACSFYIPYIFYLKRFWGETSLWAKAFLIFLSFTCIVFSITGLVASISSIVDDANSFVLF